MQDIATSLRALQLLSHAAHNMAEGDTFFADHKFLGKLYPEYEEAYDSVVERAIGEEWPINLINVSIDAAALSRGKYDKTVEMLKDIVELEKQLRTQIAKTVPEASDGTQNLLQGIADESLTREYLISRRIK